MGYKAHLYKHYDRDVFAHKADTLSGPIRYFSRSP